MAVGYHGNVIPHTALIHRDRPRRIPHCVVIRCGSSVELYLLAVGDRGEHGSLLRLADAGATALTGHQAHPLICCGPVLREIVKIFQGISVFERLFVDRRCINCDQIGAGFRLYAAVISAEYHAAAGSGHAVLGKGEIIFPVGRIDIRRRLTVCIELHLQVVVIAGCIQHV